MDRRVFMLVGSTVLACGDTVVASDMDGSSDTAGTLDDESPVTIASIELAFHRTHDDVFSPPAVPGPNEIRGKQANDPGIVLIARSDDERLSIAGWSFDGAFLGVTRTPSDPDAQRSDVLIFDAESTEAQVIADAAAPRFSPTRRELVFARGSEVMLFDLDTRAERRVGTGLAIPCSWSPAGDRLAVLGEWLDDPPRPGLFIVDVASGDATRVEASGPSMLDLGQQGCVHWSPQGDVLAFVSNALSPDVDSAVHVVDVDGSGLRVLPGDDFRYGVRRLWWSPTADRIATASWTFDSIYTTDYFIELIGLDGSASIAASAATDYAWGPDERVAIVELTPEGNLFTATHRIRVGEWQSALEDAQTTDSSPSWRPTSSK